MEEIHFKGRKVLITGGLGFIGSNLARRLVHLGAEVVIVDSLIPQYGGNLFNISDIQDKISINVSDVRDEHSFRNLVQGKDYLFNLAAQTSHLDSMNDPYTDLEINCRAQLSILEACRQYNPTVRVVFTSTRQLYGKPDYLPVDEKHLLRPVDVNGINKMAGEWYHILYNNVYGIRSTALRLTNTYGPGMRVKDTRQTFLGIWIRLLLEGKPFEVWGGEQLRDYTYVDDVVDALLMAAVSEKAAGKIYNLGGDCVISLQGTAKTMVEANGGGEYVVREFPAERKRIDIGDYFSDYKLFQLDLGWTPKVSLLDGLTNTLNFYRKNLEHYL
ncbi:NAD-dependent epimerase/dehydratase family protein [Leptolyngbya sp. KIOST-1]|uniref:NAD-dependent epimerase/dehydratase family protein n=1 Tax=Leptolyngbya sp. KIOST-1 TaxID=1229172 RepID=UPI0005608DB7|nr:NAD-dependent epimerase/dehydratase family protein [Leptolyngbya sp. KIOST-1]